MIDVYPYQPPLKPLDSPYERIRVLYDDGTFGLREGYIIAGQVLNRAFLQPYFKADRTYLVMNDRIVVIPETES